MQPSPDAVGDSNLRELWDEHAGPLLAFVLRFTDGDRGLAEDVVQETLLRAWRRPDVADPRTGSARPWLLTVARRILIDAHRARKSRPAEIGADALGEMTDDDGLDEAIDRWVVADALAALTQEHREALLQTYYAGRTAAEAAVVLGVPAGTVKSRIFYALRALKLGLEERGMST